MVNHHRLLRCCCLHSIAFHPANLGKILYYVDITIDTSILFFGQSGPGHAAVLRGGAGDARNLAEPGLKKQMTDMFGLFKLRFYTNICLTLHVMFWWTLRLMIHTAYTACVQQPTTFRIIPQPSLLRHLFFKVSIGSTQSRWFQFLHVMFLDWFIFSALTFSFI